MDRREPLELAADACKQEPINEPVGMRKPFIEPVMTRHEPLTNITLFTSGANVAGAAFFGLIFISILVMSFILLGGCGGGSTGQGALPNGGTQAGSSSSGSGGSGHLVGVWRAEVNVASQTITFTPVASSRYQSEDANVGLAGPASWASPTLSGTVTITNNGANTIYFPMAVVTGISEAGVTVANPDFYNAGSPAWKYDNLAAGGGNGVNWQFSDPAGVNFSFYVHVFAWELQYSGGGGSLTSVSFFDANTGIAGGVPHHFIHTSDGGANWNAAVSVPSEDNIAITAIDMADANTAWAVGINQDLPLGGGSIIWKTTDGGANWTAQISPLPDQDYEDVSCTDANHAVAVGGTVGGAIIRTSNGGANWIQATSIPDNIMLLGVSMVNATTGWAVGANGAIWKTTDGGDTWTAQNSGIATTLFSVSFFDANNGTAVGDDNILHTSNGGATWTSVWTTGTTVGFNSVRMVSSDEAWAVGYDMPNTTSVMYHIDYAHNALIAAPSFGVQPFMGIDFAGSPSTGDGWVVSNLGVLFH